MATSDNPRPDHSASPEEGLDIRFEQDGAALRILVSGDLILATVDELQGALRQAEQGKAEAIVVDLGGLRFVDSTGLSALLEAYSRSREDGHRMSFVPSEHSSVMKLIGLTGTGELFD